MGLPVEGYRVLDMTQNVAGPFSTQILADLGAEVIKIEPVDGGDSTRQWGPPFSNGQSAMFLAFNRNKKGVALNLRDPRAREIVELLLEKSDVFVHSMRPSTASKLDLNAESIRQRHPRVLCCELSAFGAVGDLANQPAYDPVMQGFSGLMSLTGHEGSPTVRVGTSIIDMGTGLWAALGILAGLLLKKEGGDLTWIQTSLFESGLAWLPYQILGYMATGEAPRRLGSELAMLAPYGAYETADRPIVIAIGNDRLWHSFCVAIERPDLEHYPKFVTNPERVTHRRELRDELERTLSARSATDWVSLLAEAGVPASAVNDIPTVLDHSQTAAVNMIQRVKHSSIGELSLMGAPLLFDGQRPDIRIAPPLLGEHTTSILRSLGMSSNDIEELIASGGARTSPNKHQ